MSYNLENIRVLVIDDNMPIRMLIRMLLLDLGIGHVDIAASGEEGLDKYNFSKPDIIMVDWRMEKMDGVAFTRALRQSSGAHAHQVPILMMTGFTNKEKVFQARDAGITEFLIKPFTVEALIKHIGHIIEHPRDFVHTEEFDGPDRRRRLAEVPPQEKKRQTDQVVTKIKDADSYRDLRGAALPEAKKV